MVTAPQPDPWAISCFQYSSDLNLDSQLPSPQSFGLSQPLADISALPEFLLDHVPLDEQEVAQSLFSSSLSIDPSALVDSGATITANVPGIGPLAASNTSASTTSTEVSADSYLLPVSELTLLRAFFRIATRLGCANTVWDLSAISPFCSSPDPSSSIHHHHLPHAWQPTCLQHVTPHHPLLDFLPWPSARDRIIAIFSLPEAARPPSAAGPLALVQFVYDLEDSAEGMRIWGGDPYDAESWEVGQVLFERWWFIFDRDIVEQSNKWRQLRGASTLRLSGA